jgi:hypothetical protein
MNPTDQSEQGQAARNETRRGRRSEGRGFDLRGADVERWREVGRNLGTQIEEQVHKRPYVVVGAAAGIGFVAGSLFGSRLGQMLLAAGLGYVVKNLLEGEGVESLQQGLENLTGDRPSG